jgi:SNF2 family DNA or RNA helicase
MFKTIPYKHQLEAYERSKDLEAFALFMEMGTGKSKVIVDTMCHLFTTGKIERVLIFANKGSYRNWADTQLPEHFWEDPEGDISVWGLNGVVNQKDPKKLYILVMNIEAIAYARGYDFADSFILNDRTLIVADESTTIKNLDAKRTKAAIALAKQCRYRRIMTGEPITNSPLDLYAQCQFLGSGLLGYTSYYAFRAYYANMIQISAGGRSFRKVTGYRNLDKLTNSLSYFSYRIKKEQCLDLPPKIYQTYEVELTDEQQKLYEQIREDSIAELSNLVVTAPLAITKIIRLHQITCGFIKSEDGQIKDLDSHRLERLLEVIEETDGSVIIWASYRHNIESITSKLSSIYGSNCVATYYGDTTAEDRSIGVQNFQNFNARFFVGNPKTGGFGLTLTAASTVVYYSNDYNLETRLQSEDRAHRIGQTKSVNYVDLVARGTVDEKIIKALRSKKQVASTVLGDEWRQWI